MIFQELCRELQAADGAQFTVGIVLSAQGKVGATVRQGDLLAILYAEDKTSGERIAARLHDAFLLYQGKLEVTPKPLGLTEYWLVRGHGM